MKTSRIQTFFFKHLKSLYRIVSKINQILTFCRVWQASSDQIGREQIDRFLNFIATYGKHSNSFHREYFITAGKF